MAKYNPIRTTDPDLSRVQDRIRDTANATTARLDSLQGQVDANAKLTVTTTSTSSIASPDTHVTIANTTVGMVIQLPDASDVTSILYYKNTSASVVLTLKTISANGRQQTIDGNTFYAVPISSTARLVSDGSDFHLL